MQLKAFNSQLIKELCKHGVRHNAFHLPFFNDITLMQSTLFLIETQNNVVDVDSIYRLKNGVSLEELNNIQATIEQHAHFHKLLGEQLKMYAGSKICPTTSDYLNAVG